VRRPALTRLALCFARSFESASAHLAPLSPPLALPGGAAPAPLRLFASAAVAVSGKGAPVAQAASDAACFVGAPVWALDWCPRAPGAAADFLALATHAAGAPPQPLGAPAFGPAALQLWRVPLLSSSAAAADASKKPADAAAAGASKPRPAKQARTSAGGGGAAAMEGVTQSGDDAAASALLPSLALLLTHAGGTAWDVKWRPAPARASGAAAATLGLLAAALGDGVVVVAAVPRPQAQGQAALRLRPAWRGRAGPASTSAGGLPWTLDWHPHAPHSLLLAGATDGRVMIWDLEGCACADDASAPDLPLMQLSLPGPCLAVRSVCWAPAQLGPVCDTLLCAAGDDGSFAVWDCRQPDAPLWRGRGASSLLLAAQWVAQPQRMFVAATDSGRVLVASGLQGRAPAVHEDAALRPGGQSLLRGSPTGAALWSLHVANGAHLLSLSIFAFSLINRPIYFCRDGGLLRRRRRAGGD